MKSLQVEDIIHFTLTVTVTVTDRPRLRKVAQARRTEKCGSNPERFKEPLPQQITIGGIGGTADGQRSEIVGEATIFKRAPRAKMQGRFALCDYFKKCFSRSDLPRGNEGLEVIIVGRQS